MNDRPDEPEGERPGHAAHGGPDAGLDGPEGGPRRDVDPHGSRPGGEGPHGGSHPGDAAPHGTGHPGGAGPHGKSHPGSAPHRRSYDEAPLLVTWEVTQACDLQCDHCRADAQPDRHPDELSTAEGRALLDDVAEFDPQPLFVVSGGDPLKRPDLLELVEYAVSLGLTTAVTPAPTPSLDRAALQELADAGVGRIALSLDGATPEAHDGFRGEPGSFETVERAAAAARDVGLSVQINTTVTANTVEDLPAIADLVEAWGAVMWEVFFLVPVGRGEQLAQLTPERADEVMAWLYERQQEASFRVITVEAPQYRRVAAEVDGGGVPPGAGSTRAGKGFVFVSHTGEVYPSGFLSVSGGNVREDHLVDVYRSAPLFEDLRSPETFAAPCGDCEFRQRCGGSRSRANATTGDPLGADPLCPYEPGG